MLKVENLSFAYEENVNILSDVNFSLVKGEYSCLVGANGSGKSTIAKLILGLLPAKEGNILIDNEKLTIDNLSAVRDKIAIVFQNPDNQFIGSTVEDDIAFGLENHRVASSEMPAIIEYYAKEVRMEEYLSFEPGRLSGGQKQKVAIAGILAMNPDLIIFDEATSMLDPLGKREILALIKDLHQKQNKTILSITHDMEEIVAGDKVLVLDQGKIVFDGTPRELLKENELLRQAKLKLPFAADFAVQLRKRGKKVELPLSIEALTEEIWRLASKR